MKNEIMKKLTSILLVVCMLASFVPPVFAAEGDEAEPAETAEEAPAETAPEVEPDPTAEPVQVPAESEPEQAPAEAAPAQAPAQESSPAAPAPVQEAPTAAQPAAPVEAIAMPQGMELRGSTLAIAVGYSFTTDQIAGAIAGAEGPVTAIENRGAIAEGMAVIDLPVLNYQGSSITGGTFTGDVSGYVKITGGAFYTGLTNPAGRIAGGIFYAAIDTGANTLIISGGEFYGNVKGRNLIISGGTFMESSAVNIVSVGGIEGGEFYGDVDCRYSLLRAGTFHGTVENRSGVFYEDEENQLVFAPEATIHNDADGRIYAGTYPCTVVNDGEIHGGTFNGDLTNNGTIYDGVFEKPIVNNGVILGGTFNDSAVNNSRILGGVFNGATTNYSLIFGGTFLALADLGETVVLPAGLRVSSNGNALMVEAGYSFDTDTLDEQAGKLGVSSVENYGTVTAGGKALALDLINMDGAVIESGEFDGAVYVDSGYFVINGGTFNRDIIADRDSSKSRTIVIKGGTFSASVRGRNLVINGGTFTDTSAVTIEAVGSINGGTFDGTVYIGYGVISGGQFNGDLTTGGDVYRVDSQTPTFAEDITITNNGTLSTAEYPCAVVNYGTIKAGSYTGEVTNYGVIEGGTFSLNVTNTASGVIRAGDFSAGINDEAGGVVLREGFDISADRMTLIVTAGTSVTTDEIMETVGWTTVTAVENQGTITAGENAMTLPLTNNGAIQGGVFQADVTNTGKGTITGGAFNRALINSGSVTGAALNGAIRAKSGRISGCTYGENAAVEELAGGSYVEVHYYTVSNGQTSSLKSAAYGANVLSTLGKPATGYSWYAGSNDSEDNLVGADDTFSLETVTYVQVRGAAPAINWDSVTASAGLYGAALSTSKLSYADENGTFAWKAPTTKLTVEGGQAGYTVVYTPSAASKAAYDYSGVPMEMDIPVQVKPRDITIYLYNATKTYGSDDPKLWGAYTGTIGSDVFSFTVTREPGENVGTYKITAQYEENPNYTVTVTPATLTIYKLAVTVVPNAAAKTVGDKDPVFTATVSAIPTGCDPVSYSLVRDPGESVGIYTIRAVAGDNPNYQVVTTQTAKLTIGRKALSAAKIGQISQQPFTGSAITPAVTVTDGSTVLQAGVDYTVSYKNNTWPGTATVTVTGKGNYEGTVSAQFAVTASEGWQTVSGKRYYFNGSMMLTGFQTIDGEKYYFNTSGVMQTGLQTVSSIKYYFDTNGVMQTGWQTISGKKYYFNSSGAAVTGLQTIDGKKYYMASTGEMLTGYQTVNGKKEYFEPATGILSTSLATPALSGVTATTNGVQITWGKVTDAQKYRVFYKIGSGSWTKLTDTASTSFTWTGAKSGTKYSFTVQCLSSDGAVYTSSYNTTGKSITYIAAPKVSSVVNTTNGVQITWGKVTGAAKYRVFYKTGSGGWTKLADTTSTSYTWTKPKSGTEYSFTVRCISSDGKSYTSAYDTTGKSITYIAAPKISSVKKTSTGVKITWGKVTGAAMYRVFYKTGSGGWKQLADVTGTSYTWTGPKNGTKYYFTVRCISSDGKSYTSAYDATGKSITYEK